MNVQSWLAKVVARLQTQTGADSFRTAYPVSGVH